MIEKSSLDAIKTELMAAKEKHEQSLKRLNEIKSKLADPVQLAEINKTIMVLEKSLKAYADL